MEPEDKDLLEWQIPKQAVEQANEIELSQIPSEDIIKSQHEFSREFISRMENNIAIENKKIRKNRFYKNLKKYAAVFLILIIGAMGTYVTVDAVQRAIQIISMENNKISAEFTVKNPDSYKKSSEEVTFRLPTYLPRGMKMVDEVKYLNIINTTYEDKNKNSILIQAMLTSSAGSLLVDNEHSTQEIIQVNGYVGHLFLSNVDGYSSFVVWADDVVRYCLTESSGEMNKAELLKIAESFYE